MAKFRACIIVRLSLDSIFDLTVTPYSQMETNPIVDDGFKYKPTVTNVSENVSQTYY